MQRSEKLKNIAVLQLAVVMFSFCGVLSKLAAQRPFLSVGFFLLYGASLGIMFLYALIWQQMLKKFELTVAYANRSMQIGWVLLWSFVFFGEVITWKHIVGAALIVVGIILVTSDD